MMLEICVLEYLYNLSDPEVVKRIQTDVAANTNYPSEKKMICESFRRMIRKLKEFNESLGNKQLVIVDY